MRWIVWLVIVGIMGIGYSEEKKWKPYAFKGNETFVFELKQVRGDQEKKGRYVIDMSREGKRLVMRLEGKFDGMEGQTVVKAGAGSEIQQKLLPQMFFNPWMAPFTLAMFAQGITTALTAAMTTEGEPGSKRVYKHGGQTTEYRVETCEFQGKKGKQYTVLKNGKVSFASCVIPDIALPVYVKTRSKKETLEVILKEYKEK